MIYPASLFQLKTGAPSPHCHDDDDHLPTTPSPNSDAETPNDSLTDTRR